MYRDIETNLPEDDPDSDPRVNDRATVRQQVEGATETEPVFGGPDASIAGWWQSKVGSGGVTLRTPWGPKIEAAFAFLIYVVGASLPMLICLLAGVHDLLAVLVGVASFGALAVYITRPTKLEHAIPARKTVIDGQIQGEPKVAKVDAGGERIELPLETPKANSKVKTPDAS
ncbi:hypothetical protein BS329_09615 [Amycolatopsis coloradensis]|uniref:Uncharacterized protein n=1 Tax=Amycolatopsis coloradensis TaxID=76021 RepID=A0A1R0KVV8_9PSEU|nr:hypothetical protein [Amycolatopsis coloradensis]OLZ53083.1 hypothetical protein BS329_09615 [Amycolatopsis coloradensis]